MGWLRSRLRLARWSRKRPTEYPAEKSMPYWTWDSVTTVSMEAPASPSRRMGAQRSAFWIGRSREKILWGTNPYPSAFCFHSATRSARRWGLWWLKRRSAPKRSTHAPSVVHTLWAFVPEVSKARHCGGLIHKVWDVDGDGRTCMAFFLSHVGAVMGDRFSGMRSASFEPGCATASEPCPFPVEAKVRWMDRIGVRQSESVFGQVCL